MSDDHGDTVETSTLLPDGQIVQGTFTDAADKDGFRFEAEAGTRFSIRLTYPDGETASTPTATARVFTPDAVVDHFRDFDAEGLVIEGVVQASGTQFLELIPVRVPFTTDPVPYAVTLEILNTDVPDDHSDVREGATTLTAGTAITGTIEHPGDIDVFAFDRDLISAFQITAEKTSGTDGLSISVIDQADVFGNIDFSLGVFDGGTIGNQFQKTLSGLVGRNLTYIQVSGPIGGYELSADFFTFGDTPAMQFDRSILNTLDGALSRADVFFMRRDGELDLIPRFESGLDQIDVSEFGAEQISDLEISNELRSDGSVRWVQVGIAGESEAEFRLRFGDGTPLDATSLRAEDFIFLPPSVRTAGETVTDTDGLDSLRGTDAAERFVLLDDGARDLIRDFQVGRDVIDVSAFAFSLDDLEIANQVRRDGSINWVTISDSAGEVELALRFADGLTPDAGVLGADSFVFSDTPIETDRTVADTSSLDRIEGSGGADIFVLMQDGIRDQIRNFDATQDVIDVSAFAFDLDDLQLSNQTRRDGSVSWINIADFEGQTEVALRLTSDTTNDATALTAENFIFSDVPFDRKPAENRVLGTDARDQMRGTEDRDIFVMQDDFQIDLVRGFQPGVDVFDLSDFNLGFSGGDVVALNVERKDGSVSWVELYIDRFSNGVFPGEEADFRVKFAPGVPLDLTSFGAEDFIF